jgi:hypothetical protein
MTCQGGTLGYSDIWYLQRGHTVSTPDGEISPEVLTAAPSAPADQNLRDRIRRAICEAEGFAWDTDMLEPDEYGEVADAVLAVLPAGATADIRKLVKRLVAHAKGFQDVLDEGDSGAWGRTVGADIEELRAAVVDRPAPADRAAVADVAAAIVAALQERAGELSDLAEEQMRPSLEERAQEWREAASVARRMVDEAQQAPPAVDRRDVQAVLTETVAVYAADRLGVSVADVLDAAADASAAKRAPTRPAGWAQGREWKADLLHQQADAMRAADEAQQAGEGRG